MSIAIGFVVVAGISASITREITRRQAEEAVEAVNASCAVSSAAQMLAILDMSQREELDTVRRRIVEMAGVSMASYNRSKLNGRILPQTHQAAANLTEKLAKTSETRPQ